MKIDIDRFNKDGFLLIKNVLTAEEVQTLRDVAYRTIEEDEKKGTYIMHRHAKNHLGCLSNISEFKDLILDDRTIEIAEKLLGDRPVFFGDSIVEIGIGNRGFHKDTSERKTQDHPDWTEEYPILRIGFYLEDHKNHSGGLKVRVGSHNTVKADVGKPYIIPSEAGDAVVWSLKTSHAGNAVKLKIAPKLSLHNSIEKRVPKFLRVPEEKERVSIFLTYGLRSGAMDRFLEYMYNHKAYQKRIDCSEFPDELIEEINEKIDFHNVKEDYESRKKS